MADYVAIPIDEPIEVIDESTPLIENEVRRRLGTRLTDPYESKYGCGDRLGEREEKDDLERFVKDHPNLKRSDLHYFDPKLRDTWPKSWVDYVSSASNPFGGSYNVKLPKAGIYYLPVSNGHPSDGIGGVQKPVKDRWRGKDESKGPVYHGGKDMVNDSILGAMLEDLGYQYLGPGTKFEAKRAAGVQPINDLDLAAFDHDAGYQETLDRFEAGEIDYQAAKGLISIYDENLMYDIEHILRTQVTSPLPLIAGASMNAKMLYDYMTGTSAFSQLVPERYGVKRRTVYQPPVRPVEKPVILPPNRYKPQPVMPIRTFDQFDYDRDRNYYPDRLQAKTRKRKRFHKYV